MKFTGKYSLNLKEIEIITLKVQNQIKLTGGSFQGKVVSVCQGEGNLVLIMDATATHDGQEFTWRRINHYQLAKGRIFEGWIYEGDQYTADIVFA